jgi:hypothetical protein
MPGLSRARFQILHMMHWELQRLVTARLKMAGFYIAVNMAPNVTLTKECPGLIMNIEHMCNYSYQRSIF